MATNTTEKPTVVTTSDGQAREEIRRDQDSTTGLLSRLFDEVTTLMRKELALARSEISESIVDARTGITSLASGGAVLYAGFLVLLMAAVIGLAQVMEAWLSALIVGAVVAIVGYIMLQSGRKKLRAESLTPDRTREALRKDRDALQRRTPQ